MQYLYVYSCVVLRILHCPLSGPDLIYISLRIIFCIIEYVTNKRTLTYFLTALNDVESVTSWFVVHMFLAIVNLWRLINKFVMFNCTAYL